MKIKHYAQFVTAGSFVSETSSIPVDSRDVAPTLPPRAYGWSFFDRWEGEAPDGTPMYSGPLNESAWTYIGRELTLEDAKKLHAQGSFRASKNLIWNMEANNWSRVLECSQGCIPLKDGDVVIRDDRGSW